MSTPLNHVPEQDSDARMHVMDEDCWCNPCVSTEAGSVTAIHHADEMHVLPVGDRVAHDEAWDCVCGPFVESGIRGDNTVGRVIIHHSVDGREVRR